MLTRFEVENFKNFKDKLIVDFTKVGGYQFNKDCISNDLVGKMLIYGKNAVGKTNLGEAIIDIKRTLDGIQYTTESSFLNVDSTEDYASFVYEFNIEKKQIIYKYSKYGNNKLRDEELFLDGTRIFSCGKNLSQSTFENLHMIQAENVDLQRYKELVSNDADKFEIRIPFLRYLMGFVPFSGESVMRRMEKYVRTMEKIALPSRAIDRRGRILSFLEDKKELNRLERFLSYMGIPCKLKTERLPDGRIELYFENNRLIPFFQNASSGTLALFNVYEEILAFRQPVSFLYIDEFDANYHYEMARNLIHFLKEEYPECQVILTTHNTNLMSNRLLRPDCLFILSSDGKLTALCDATERELREGHNLEKMYISGEFAKYE